MDELISKIEQNLDSSGEITWDNLLNVVDYPERQQLPTALKLAKADGRLRKRVDIVDGHGLVTVYRPSS